MQNTRDRMSSKPISQTGYTPDWKRKQEMQEDPQRASYEASSSTSTPHSGPPPLPVRRNTRPGQSQVQYQEEGEEEPEIDWTNLTYEDKQVFFSWLDEFFARGSTTQNNNTPARPTAPPISSRSSLSSSSMNTPPPPTRGPPVREQVAHIPYVAGH